MSFHLYSSQICGLHFTFVDLRFRGLACYFPTSWDSDENVAEMYDMLNLVLVAYGSDGAIPLLGGDSNANSGMLQPEDGPDLVGSCGVCPRNEPGWLLSRWVGMRGLQILNRLKPQAFKDDNWTRRRAADGALVQLDFILGSVRCYGTIWVDDSFPIGLDHRCVHRHLRI